MKTEARIGCGPDGLNKADIEVLKKLDSMFHFDLVIYYAAAEDIEKLKEAGFSGVSRKQKETPLYAAERVTPS